MRIVTRVGVLTAVLVVALLWVLGGLAAQAQGARAMVSRPADAGDNPTPHINSLSPSAAVIGGAAFTLTVDGVGFVPASQVDWNGQALATTYLSESQLTAQVDATSIATQQTATVTVDNPPPGGGVSPPVSFAVAAPNPVPDVTGISPALATVGDGAFSIAVIGSGFVPGSTVLWNGGERTTGFISDFMLTASIPASDLAAVGTAFVGVVNPQPGGGQSASARVFTIVYPAPVAAQLEPASVWAGGPAFTLTVTGSGFTPASVVQWAGADKPTTYVSPQSLQAQIAAADIAYAGTPAVRVSTPTPGGGVSTPLIENVKDDDVPPVTTVSGLTGLWHRTTTDFSLVATDVGLGVQCTFYRIGASGDYSIGNTVRVRAPKDHRNDGVHVVYFFSVDKILNWENPPKQVEVAIDTRPPATAVSSATVIRSSSVKLHYRVDDLSCPRARDTLVQVLDGRGRVVLSHGLGQPLMNGWHTAPAWKIILPRGTYRMRVLAHDLAGNAQSSAQSAALTVR